MSHKQTFREAFSPTARNVTIVDGDDLHIGVEVNAGALRESAKALRDLNDHEPLHKDMRLAAIIPEDVLQRSYQEGWFNDRRAWKRWANDPDHRDFRVWEGQL